MSFLSGAKDLLFGKKEAGYAPGRYELDPNVKAARDINLGYQKTGMERLAAATSGDVNKEVEAQAAREARGVQATTQDAAKRLQQLINQRGIGRTSVGLTQQVAQEQTAQDRIAEIKASIPERIRALKLQNANLLLQASNQSLQSPGVQGEAYAGYEGGRKGGLAPLIGMAAGGIASGGNPAAMQVGMGAGQYLQGMA